MEQRVVWTAASTTLILSVSLLCVCTCVCTSRERGCFYFVSGLSALYPPWSAALFHPPNKVKSGLNSARATISMGGRQRRFSLCVYFLLELCTFSHLFLIRPKSCAFSGHIQDTCFNVAVLKWDGLFGGGGETWGSGGGHDKFKWISVQG